MRVVVALGGNALLKRGEKLSAENQRDNARIACKSLAPLAREHELVISHGNGPQVGLLALQAARAFSRWFSAVSCCPRRRSALPPSATTMRIVSSPASRP